MELVSVTRGLHRLDRPCVSLAGGGWVDRHGATGQRGADGDAQATGRNPTDRGKVSTSDMY
jgi:hypothetical protein